MSETHALSYITPERLRRFFRPHSIALVGATDNSRWSIYTFENLQRYAFPGPIYLIHPQREIVHGQRALKSLRDLPEPVDLAYIMVPTTQVLPVIKEATELGTTHFVVLTAGFGETGVDGARMEHDLMAFAREHKLTLLGPNGNGFINITDRITPYGLPIMPPLRPGPVGIVLQSGALASAVLAFSQAHAIGLSLLVAMGNESMLSVTDIMDYLLEDDATRVIALFLESIRHPAELRRVAEKARERGKAIVALKVGSSEASARTALAHTGALVGNDMLNDAALRQLGIIRVHSLEDLLTTAGLIGYNGPLPGRKMGVVTASGGACSIISDLAQAHGIIMPDFAAETVEQLRSILPIFSTAHNPLDVTGYIVVDGTLQQRSLDIVVNDPNIDFVLNLVGIEATRAPNPAALQLVLERFDKLTATIRAAPCPVVLVSYTCLDLQSSDNAILERTGLHFAAGLEHGIRAIGQLLWWSELLHTAVPDQQYEAQEQLTPLPALPYPQIGNWSEAQGRQLLQMAGIPVIPGILATSPEEAIRAAQDVGSPVALKIQSANILHKSDVGGVALNLSDDAAIRSAFTAMLERVRAAVPEAEIEGILVSPMRSAATELLVSIVRDPLWGPVLTLGLGGIWTEALKDTAVRLLPVRREEIMTMLSELRGAVLLKGDRGHTAADLHTLSDVIYRLSVLAWALGPQLHTLEINPLRVEGSYIEVLDILVNWQA